MSPKLTVTRPQAAALLRAATCALILLLLNSLLIGGTTQARAQTAGTLTVQADQVPGTFSPYVFASYMDPNVIVPPDLLPQAKAMGLKYLRFGDDWSDDNGLTPSIIDFFVMEARLIGADPAITVRLLNLTPEAAVKVLRYANIEKKYGINY